MRVGPCLGVASVVLGSEGAGAHVLWVNADRWTEPVPVGHALEIVPLSTCTRRSRATWCASRCCSTASRWSTSW